MDKHNDVILVYTIFDKYICFAREIPYSVAYTLTQERVAKLTALLGTPRIDAILGPCWSAFTHRAALDNAGPGEGKEL